MRDTNDHDDPTHAERDGSDVAPDRADGAPSSWNPDRTGPSREQDAVTGDVGRSEPWAESAETAEGGFRSADDPQAGEVAKLPGR